MDVPDPVFDSACPDVDFPFRIGDKWTAMVVLCLEHGERRFGELKNLLPGVTGKVLSETLRAMVRDGLVRRIDYDENPPHVEYCLTSLGRSVLTVIDHSRRWAREHYSQMSAARAEYDARSV